MNKKGNSYIMLQDNLIGVVLTRGKVACIDPVDFHLVDSVKWQAIAGSKGNFYAKGNGGNRKQVAMHRLILGLTDKEVLTDHINGNGLDNRRANLRACTHAQNIRNRGVANARIRNSIYKGVHINFRWKGNNSYRKWHGMITSEGRKISLGYFHDEVECAKAYNVAALKYHGEFANLNVIKEEANARD